MTKMVDYIYEMHKMWTKELKKAEILGDNTNITYCKAKLETYDAFVMGIRLRTFEDVKYE